MSERGDDVFALVFSFINFFPVASWVGVRWFTVWPVCESAWDGNQLLGRPPCDNSRAWVSPAEAWLQSQVTGSQ